MMKKIASLSLLIVASSSRTLLAHPGHGKPVVENTPLHYLLEPSHSLPFFVGAFLVISAVYFLRTSRSQNQ
ncbi:MAG: hypothetical protein JKY95_17855 [Planctomycetaceae bacterium]|nr:hypothetical protein [Planctomycetaceae bacterium]